MTKFEIGTAIALVTFIFGAGAAWNSIGSRFDRLNEKVAAIEGDKAEGLCLAVLSRQITAIEKGNNSVRDQLQTLAARHCPSSLASVAMNASALKPMTAEELRREQVEWVQTLNTLGYIDSVLEKPRPSK